MKVTIYSTPKVVFLEKIPHGTVFTGKIGNYDHKVFAKIDKRIYPLDAIQPVTSNLYWEIKDTVVENYLPVKEMSLTV